MGAGLALQIKQAYPEVFTKYRYACLNTQKDLLGCVQIIGKVVNIFGQRSYGTNTRKTDYDALKTAFTKLHNKLPIEKSIAFPYGFGCGLAGGDWKIVSNLITNSFKNRKVKICIFKK
jgi:O-acetyl-ADP-ribose deacetylase (regulator of RNase III)